MASTSYLDRFLDPLTEALTPEIAGKIVNLRVDPELQAQIDDLRHKANEGSLTAAEDEEYKGIVEAIDLISILQAKARRVLGRNQESRGQ